MIETKDFTFLSSNKTTQIHARAWIPEGEPKAIMQIAHGIGEHVGRYDHFATFLAENGFLVVANDHLGHGDSFQTAKTRGFFAEKAGWMRVVDDMHRLYELVHGKFPHAKYFLLGHSMGSFLARSYVIRHQGNLSGLLLSGTGHQRQAKVSFGISFTNRLINRYGPYYRSKKVTVLAFGNFNTAFMPIRTFSDWLSRDEEMIDEHLADEKCNFTPTVSMYRDMFAGIKYMSSFKNICRMEKNLPVYFFSGDMDPVGEAGKGVKRAFDSFLAAGMSDLSIKLYPEGRHEMLNEINKTQVYDDLLAWTLSKLQ